VDKQLLKVEEAAAVLSLGRSKVYELLACGELPAVKIGRATRVPADSLRRWVDERAAAVEKPPEPSTR
jgi:excisionase family DNA binding protein